MIFDPEIMDYFARFHTVLKEPLKQAIWRRSYNKYREWQVKNPKEIDPNSDQAKYQAGAYAYNEAMRGILLRDNAITHFWNKILNSLSNVSGEGSKGRKAGEFTAALGRFLMPIVRVPTNFAFEASEYQFGGLKGLAAIGKHLVSGTIKDLTPTQADYIARNLKKGTVGALLMYIGYKNRDHIGGYYEKGDKKQKGDPGFGSFTIGSWKPKFFGIDFGPMVVHNAAMESMNFGATFGHIMDKLEKKNKVTAGNTAGAVVKSSLGVAEETPYASVPTQLITLIENPSTLGAFFGQLISGAVEPPDLGKIAKAMDLDANGDVVKRQKGIWETPAGNIPFVRNEIPEATKSTETKPSLSKTIKRRSIGSFKIH
jgi:hypothetical protein